MTSGSRLSRFLMGLVVLVIVAGLIMSTCSLPTVA
jgi:hypothetical protein